MLIGPNGVPVMTNQQVACAQVLVSGDGDRDLRPQRRHTQACPALTSRCLGGGGHSQWRCVQAGSTAWPRRRCQDEGMVSAESSQHSCAGGLRHREG